MRLLLNLFICIVHKNLFYDIYFLNSNDYLCNYYLHPIPLLWIWIIRPQTITLLFVLEWVDFYRLWIQLDFLSLLHSNFCGNQMLYKVRKRSFTDFIHFYIAQEFKLNKQNINQIQSRQKSTVSNSKYAFIRNLIHDAAFQPRPSILGERQAKLNYFFLCLAAKL